MMAAGDDEARPFARRIVRLDDEHDVPVTFYAPVEDGRHAFRCDWEIVLPRSAKRRHAYGVDGVDALRNAMFMAEAWLLSSDEGRAGSLTWLGQPNLGLTIDLSWAQPDYSKRARATPLLLFHAQAAEAMAFYVSLFDDHEILVDERDEPSEGDPQERVRRAVFRIAFQNFICADVIDEHAVGSKPPTSIGIECVSEAEIARLTKALSEEGAILTPLRDNGSGGRIAWVRDRFGVVWRLNVA